MRALYYRCMKTLDDLKKYLGSLPNSPREYVVAVGGLIFTKDDKLILLERGSEARDSEGLLEGVGGAVDDQINLHGALRREVEEELGNDLKIAIDDLLTVVVLPSTKNPKEMWVVVHYLCRVISGEPVVMEPHKCNAVLEYRIEDIPKERLSIYQRQTMKAYRDTYGNKPYYS